MILAQVTLSTEELAVMAGLLGSLATAVVWLWRLQVTAWAEQTADLQRQRDELLGVILRRGLKDSVPMSVPREVVKRSEERQAEPWYRRGGGGGRVA